MKYPEFMTIADLCREEKFAYSTFKRRADMGDIEYHLVNRKAMIRVSDGLALMAKIQRRSMPLTEQVKGNDLFAA